ncbi:MAG TPA: peptide chain release factor N(5)-glutamine methyltransferase [Clostridiaceae bacterium]|nr:peptide chain release factor N(5)-glutamine methyltransferase [Clostridiaceae bacterium]
MKLEELATEITELFTQADLAEPRREMRLFLREIAGLELAEQLRKPDLTISVDESNHLRRLARRRAKREPLAYIKGQAWFYGRSFLIEPGLMVPRPDSEILIEAALLELTQSTIGERLLLLDSCCGTGCLGLTLLAELQADRKAKLHLLDSSRTAIEVATRNAARLGLETAVTYEQADLWPKSSRERENEKFDVILCNPPYIASNEIAGLMPEVRDHESHLALDGGADGLDFYRRIAAGYRDYLKPEGLLILELGAGQADAVTDIFNLMADQSQFSKQDVSLEKMPSYAKRREDRLKFYRDYNGYERSLVVRGYT